MTREQAASYDSVTWLSILNHSGLSLFMGVIGLLSGSKAMLAGALYSGADAVSEVAEKLQLPLLKSRTNAHNDNHRRHSVQPPVAIILTVLLLMGGIQMGISSISAISNGIMMPPESIAGVAIVVSIALKEAVFQYQLRKLNLQSVQAVQKQNKLKNHRSSLYSSVIALIGIFGAITGEEMNLPLLLYLEPITALIIACLILWKGYRIIVSTIYGSLISGSIHEDTSLFVETVQRVQGVISVDELKAEEQGHYVYVVARISVNPRISMLEAHDIANRAKMLLLNRFSHVSEVNIQVVPYDPGYPYKSNHQETGSDMPNLLQ